MVTLSITFAVTRADYRIVYEEDAMALTQAPQTVRQFLTQRFRWIFGMLQTAWKHRGAVLEGRAIGLFGIPNILLFTQVPQVGKNGGWHSLTRHPHLKLRNCGRAGKPGLK